MSWMDQNLPFGCGANQERTGWTGSNLPILKYFVTNLKCGTSACPEHAGIWKRKAVFCYYRRVFWKWLDSLSVAPLFFFPGLEKQHFRNQTGVWTWCLLFDSTDASGRILCLWWCGFEERLLKGPLFSSLSFLVVIQHFYLFWYSSVWRMTCSLHSRRHFQAVSLLTASLV